MPLRFEQKRRETATKLVALMLSNAFIFQEQLSAIDGRVLPIRSMLSRQDFVTETANLWQMIVEQIDYVPIFKVAHGILTALPADEDTDVAIANLARRSLDIVAKKAALRHDLMGRIYHLLLQEAKYLGTYYTSVPAATLLLKLALDIDNSDIDWSDIDQISQLRIADLACGTGTLLMAANQAITDNFVKSMAARGEAVTAERLTRLHTVLVETALYGYDVLPSAVHLTASTLAMLAPETCFRKMQLYSLPLGRMQSGEIYLGSIDYISADLIRTQLSLMGREAGAERIGDEDAESVAPLPRLNLCVMNPPFVRSVGGNLLFGSLHEHRHALQERLAERLRTTRLSASSTAGLGSVFTGVGDQHVEPGGRLALVLPAAVTTGVAWEKTRALINGKYVLEKLVSSHHPDRWNFSENTDLSEVLIVARKRRPGDTDAAVAGDRTQFINLWHNPGTSVQALSIGEAIARGAPAPLERNGQPFAGVSRVMIGGTQYGEAVEIPWADVRSGPWLGACFAQTELIRTVWFLRKGELFVPGRDITLSLPITALGKLGTLGPDRRDIHDGYELSNSRTAYAAYWGHDSNRVRMMAGQINRWLSPRTEPAPNRRAVRNPPLLWSRSGPLMIAERLWLITQRLVAVQLPESALSNVWWPYRLRKPNEVAEKALVLCLNSTLGIMTFFGHRAPTRGPWVDFKKPLLAALPVLDVLALGKQQLTRLASLYDM
jgi:hypothetical protein